MTRRIFETAYDFHQPDGTLWFQHLRWRFDPPTPRPKDFSYRWWPTPYRQIHEKREGADDLIYRLPAVLAAQEAGETIWWTEGERDADGLSAVGVVATSHHGGAGKTTPEQAGWFRGHRGLVVLLYDLDRDDERGGNPGAFDVIRRYRLLREVGIPRDQIAVGHARAGKDVSDHLAAGHSVDELVWLRDLTGLFRKAARTTSATFGRSGYKAPSLTDLRVEARS
jgi:hypothetical protein